MILESMGSMGNMHGVKASSSPAPKNNSRVKKRLPLTKDCASRSCSETNAGGAEPAVGAEVVASLFARVSAEVLVMGG